MALALVLPAVAGATTTPGRIDGIVTAEVGGKPIEGISVCAEPFIATGEGSYECDTTRADGTFEIDGLKPGEYLVEFWPQKLNYAWQYYDGAHTHEAATPVTVTSGAATSGIDAALEPEATISGLVTVAATGLPVYGVEVCAGIVGGESGGCAVTGTDGTYTIERLAAGEYEVFFNTEETEQNLLSEKYPGGPVTVSKGQPVTGIDVALKTGGQILGTVRSATTNTGLSGVIVCLSKAAAVQPLGCLKTGSSGAYRFYGIWTESFKVVFSPEVGELFSSSEYEFEPGEWADPYPTQWWNQQSSFAAATPIAMTAGQTVSGIDGLLTPPPTQTVPPVTTTPTKPVSTQVKKVTTVKCRRGFVKRKVKGKARCVKRSAVVRHGHKK